MYGGLDDAFGDVLSLLQFCRSGFLIRHIGFLLLGCQALGSFFCLFKLSGLFFRVFSKIEHRLSHMRFLFFLSFQCNGIKLKIKRHSRNLS